MSSVVTAAAECRQDERRHDDAARERRAPEPRSRPAGALGRLRLFSGLALVALGATSLILFGSDRTVSVPLARGLEAIPATLDSWRASTTPPGDVIPEDPGARQHLLRTYQSGSATVWVSVGYYPVLMEGRHPKAQQILLPGKGYIELTARTTTIPLEGGAPPLPANLLLMRTPERDLSIVYWYQLGRAPVASDHGYRALLLYRRVWLGRSDVALVRVVSPVPKNGDPAPVVASQMHFIRALYPDLARSFAE